MSSKSLNSKFKFIYIEGSHSKDDNLKLKSLPSFRFSSPQETPKTARLKRKDYLHLSSTKISERKTSSNLFVDKNFVTSRTNVSTSKEIENIFKEWESKKNTLRLCFNLTPQAATPSSKSSTVRRSKKSKTSNPLPYLPIIKKSFVTGMPTEIDLSYQLADENKKIDSSFNANENTKKVLMNAEYITRNLLQEKDEFCTDYVQEALMSQELKLQSIKEIRDKIHEELAYNAQLEPTISIDKDFGEIFKGTLSCEDLRFIEKEYLKQPEKRNYFKLASVLSKLSFFGKFKQEICVELLKKCKFKSYKAGKTIVRQGESGEYMFVIICGSVDILKKSPEFGNLEIKIHSMYDGQTFGERALLATSSDNSKRAASCIASEKTYMIAIPKDDYRLIFQEQLQVGIQIKVDFFNGLKLFEGTEALGLIPLATNIDPKIYGLNEIILEKGKKPKGLYVIYSGICTVYWEGYSCLPKFPSENISPKLKSKIIRPFLTGNNDMNARADNVWKTVENYQKKLLYKAMDLSDPEEVKKAEEFFGESVMELSKKNHIFKERLEINILRVGDFFGGRTLLKTPNKDIDDTDNIDVEPAKFSVISSSHEMKLFILNQKHLGLLSENSILYLKALLKNTYEIDCPREWTTDELHDGFKKWQSYKQGLVFDIHKEAHLTNRMKG